MADTETQTESRPPMHGEVRQMGRSYAYLFCPFCNAEVKAFIWSMAGKGKKCIKPCLAIHYSRDSIIWKGVK